MTDGLLLKIVIGLELFLIAMIIFISAYFIAESRITQFHGVHILTISICLGILLSVVLVYENIRRKFKEFIEV